MREFVIQLRSCGNFGWWISVDEDEEFEDRVALEVFFGDTFLCDLQLVAITIEKET